MGTRSLVVFQERDTDGHLIRYVVIYEQYDGYLEGVGFKLASFLKNIRMVNGIRADERDRVANGMGCLAAQYIADSKNGPGQLYIEDCSRSLDEEFNYVVTYDRTLGEFIINVNNGENKTVEEFYDMCKTE